MHCYWCLINRKWEKTYTHLLSARILQICCEPIFSLFLSVLHATTLSSFYWFLACLFCFFRGTKMTHWRPEDGGYSWHVVSVFSEWILALTVNAFIVTLAKDIGKDDEQISLLNGRNDRETGQTDIQPAVLRERSVRWQQKGSFEHHQVKL